MPEDKTGFIDTNIWLYAFIDDDARKKDISQPSSNLSGLW